MATQEDSSALEERGWDLEWIEKVQERCAKARARAESYSQAGADVIALASGSEEWLEAESVLAELEAMLEAVQGDDSKSTPASMVRWFIHTIAAFRPERSSSDAVNRRALYRHVGHLACFRLLTGWSLGVGPAIESVELGP